MFPIRLVLCHLEGTTPFSETQVKNLFFDDMERLGGGSYRGWITMSAGTLGTGSFYQYAMRPQTALALGLIVEYAEECHHGFSIIVMRDPENRHMAPTPLSMAEYGEWLDALPPPPSARPINAAVQPDDFGMQNALVEDWAAARSQIERLEQENRELRARLKDLE